MKSVWFAAIPLLILMQRPLGGAPEERVGTEDELFSTLAIKVLKYVEWKGEDKLKEGTQIRVGVYDNAMGKGCYRAFEKLCLRYPEVFSLTGLNGSERDDLDFDLVYIAGKTKLPVELLARFENKPVLVVGEHEKILEKGGIIRFRVSRSKKAEYEINLRQARSSGLKIGSQLAKGAAEVIR